MVRIGGREITEFRSNPGQDSKISPRFSHPSPYYDSAKTRHPRCLCIKATLKNSQGAGRKVGHFSKGEHVMVRIGGLEIAEFRSNPRQNSKILPRSGHPSPQKCWRHPRCLCIKVTLRNFQDTPGAQTRPLFQGRTRRGADRRA